MANNYPNGLKNPLISTTFALMFGAAAFAGLHVYASYALIVASPISLFAAVSSYFLAQALLPETGSQQQPQALSNQQPTRSDGIDNRSSPTITPGYRNAQTRGANNTHSPIHVPFYQIKPGSVRIVPFYDSNQPLYALTNFSRDPITINSVQYPTTEHYFQAQKFKGREKQFLLQLQNTANGPMDALNLARQWTTHWTRADWQSWDKRKDSVMETALRAKLAQHQHVLDSLLSTEDACLVEDTASRDEKIWGWGNDGQGTNRLGKLWMKLRNEI